MSADQPPASRPPGPRRAAELPVAEPALRRLATDPDTRVGIFLDYDGTLTPIVRHPDLAVLSDDARTVLRRLADVCPVAIISGRDLDDVQEKVDVGGLWYAGSHGFDLRGPNGAHQSVAGAAVFTPLLDDAEEALRVRLGGIDGAWVERKRYGIAVHFREVEPAMEERVEDAVKRVHRDLPRLRMRPGKKVLELQPDLDWDKGAALLHVADALGLDPQRDVILYVGDDHTDEDAFAVLEGNGIGILVRDTEGEDRATYAHRALDGTDSVARFLSSLAGSLVSARPPGPQA